MISTISGFQIARIEVCKNHSLHHLLLNIPLQPPNQCWSSIFGQGRSFFFKELLENKGGWDGENSDIYILVEPMGTPGTTQNVLTSMVSAAALTNSLNVNKVRWWPSMPRNIPYCSRWAISLNKHAHFFFLSLCNGLCLWRSLPLPNTSHSASACLFWGWDNVKLIVMILQWWICVHWLLMLIQLGPVLHLSQCSELNHGQV